MNEPAQATRGGCSDNRTIDCAQHELPSIEASYTIAGKDFWHCIIVAAVDTTAETYLIYDPAKKSPEWTNASLLNRKWWGVRSADSAFAVNPQKQVGRDQDADAEVVFRYPR